MARAPGQTHTLGEGKREKKELLTVSLWHKWWHQVARWRVQGDRRTRSCLYPRTQDEARRSTARPAGPGPAAMLQGAARDRLHSSSSLRSLFFIPVPFDKPYSHCGHCKPVIYSGWDWEASSELCMTSGAGIIIRHVNGWKMQKGPAGLVYLELRELIVCLSPIASGEKTKVQFPLKSNHIINDAYSSVAYIRKDKWLQCLCVHSF